MYKIILLSSLFILNLYAESVEEQKPKEALGTIFSFGEGKGIFYRSYNAESYIEHAGFVIIALDSGDDYFSVMYGLSYGKYLYSLPKSKYHFKSILGLEVSYDYESSVYNDSKEITTKKIGMLSGGFGVEWGRRAHDTILFGVDFLYLLRATSDEVYRITPSAAIYALYNF